MIESFIQAFGGSREDVRVFFAPGRVNLIGEHTDYTGGYVFPAAIHLGIRAYVRPREDGMVRLQSLNFDKKVTCDVHDLTYEQEHGWANYVKGVLYYLQEEGLQLPGADLLVQGNIPSESGLSSSAALEMLTAYAFRELAAERNDTHHLTTIELVKLAQKAENEYIGVKCGIMDQFAVGMGKADHAIFLHCHDLTYEHVPLAIEGCKLVITHTNKQRGLADSKYNERRSECEQGWKIIRQFFPGKSALGQLTVEEWQQVAHEITDPTVRRRLQHVVFENDRVRQARKVLQQGDLYAFGRLMLASHESLRGQYEVTGAELDALFEAAREVPGCIGTRMTGAGFGGCTVSIVREEAVDSFKMAVEEGYVQRIGHAPDFFVCDIADGVRELNSEEVQKWPS